MSGLSARLPLIVHREGHGDYYGKQVNMASNHLLLRASHNKRHWILVLEA